MRTLAIVVLALSLAAGGCNRGSPTDAAVETQVDVRRVEDGVRLTNRTDRPVAYAVWNAGWLALFAPCTDTGPACPRLAPGASVVVSASEIGGSTATMDAVLVRWWHLVPDGAGGSRADTIQETRIEF